MSCAFSCIWAVLLCRLCLFIYFLVFWFLMFGRVLGRVRLFGVGDLPVEVRGWSKEVVDIGFEYLPSVSEVFSPCPTHRDVYLRRVVGVQVRPNEAINVGRALHEVFLSPFRLINRVGLGRLVDELYGLKQEVVKQVPSDLVDFASYVFDYAAGLLMDFVVGEYPVPISVEPQLDGTLIGFSDIIKPDLLIGLIPVEVVVSDNNEYLSRKELALTAYGLAVEAHVNNPVNYGVLITLNPKLGRIQPRLVVFDDSYRRSVIRERDEVARIIVRKDDPGVAPKCPESCPLRDHCLGGRGEARGN